MENDGFSSGGNSTYWAIYADHLWSLIMHPKCFDFNVFQRFVEV